MDFEIPQRDGFHKTRTPWRTLVSQSLYEITILHVEEPDLILKPMAGLQLVTP